jgi:putative MATE family efflux protein
MIEENAASRKGDKKYEMMISTPVGPLVCRLAVPTVVIMLVSAMYNMADTYFVSSLGTSVTAAVGVSFSLMAIIQAIGFFFGHGAGNFISRALGAKQTDEAEKMAATACVSAFLAGIVLAILGSVFLTSLARLLGATDTILPYAEEYLRFILFAAPFMVTSFMLNNLLRYQGSALFSMIGMVSGAILNIALDPLFIFIFQMGVTGAALATAISQTVSCVLLFSVGCRKGGNVRIHIGKFAPSFGIYHEILRGGSPSLLRQVMQSIATVFLNHAAGAYSDAVIAAITIVNRIFLLASSAIIGFGQSFQPICGFNYGAKRYDRVKQAFRFCLYLSTSILLVLAVVCFIFAPNIIALFRADDAELIRVGAFALRAQCFSFPLLGWILLVSFLLQTIGRAIPASILAFARQGLFMVPLLLATVPLFGILGIQLCIPIADVCTFILSLPLGIAAFRNNLAGGKKSKAG